MFGSTASWCGHCLQERLLNPPKIHELVPMVLISSLKKQQNHRTVAAGRQLEVIWSKPLFKQEHLQIVTQDVARQLPSVCKSGDPTPLWATCLQAWENVPYVPVLSLGSTEKRLALSSLCPPLKYL